MGKKVLRKKYTSSGGKTGYSPATKKLVRNSRSFGEKFMFKFKAYLDGRNPWLTIENPNKNETNKRNIRVKANDYFGNPKYR